MAVIHLIQDFRDERNRPTIRTIAEALQKLRNRGHDLETGTCEIQAPSEGGQPTYFAALAFTAVGGGKYILALSDGARLLGQDDFGNKAIFDL